MFISFSLQGTSATSPSDSVAHSPTKMFESYKEAHQYHLSFTNESVERARPNVLTLELPTRQEKRYIMIRSRADYLRIKGDFEYNIESYGLLSFDTESKNVPGEPWDTLVSVLVGAFDQWVVDFSVKDLRREAAKENYTLRDRLSDLLPRSLVRLLRDDRIMKVGSNLGKDTVTAAEDYYLEIRPVSDVQFLHQQAEEDVFGTNTGRHGLGQICFDLFGCDYKPLDDSKYYSRYGVDRPEPWRPFSSAKRLYQWREPLRTFDFIYRAADANIPIALIVKVTWYGLKHHLFSRDLVMGPQKGLFRAVARMCLATGAPFTTKSGARSVMSIWQKKGGFFEGLGGEGDDTQDSRYRAVQTTSPSSIACPDVEVPATLRVPSTLVVGPTEVERVSADDVEEMDTAKAPENSEEIVQMDETLPRYQRRPFNKKLSRHAAGTRFEGRIRGQRNKAHNCYAQRPLIGEHCSFCGSSTHSNLNAKGQVLCKARAMFTRDKAAGLKKNACDYNHCSEPDGHLIRVCPSLASRCGRCWIRGHESKSCPGTQENSERDEKLQVLRAEFEKWADSHVLLAKRHEVVAWSFHAVRRSCPESVTNAELMSKSPSEAERFLAQFKPGPAHSKHAARK